MPKVGKVPFRYKEFPTQHDLYYSNKDLFSVKGIPEDIIRVTGVRVSGYETELKLKEAIEAAIRKYREIIKAGKMMIYYKVGASSELSMNRIGTGSFQGRKPGVSLKIESPSGFGNDRAVIGIDYEIYFVMNDGVKHEYFRVDEDTLEVGSRTTLRHGDQRYQQMEYTPERHEFFKSTVEAMSKLVVKLSTVFGMESDEVCALIDNETVTKLLS